MMIKSRNNLYLYEADFSINRYFKDDYIGYSIKIEFDDSLITIGYVVKDLKFNNIFIHTVDDNLQTYIIDNYSDFIYLVDAAFDLLSTDKQTI